MLRVTIESTETEYGPVTFDVEVEKEEETMESLIATKIGVELGTFLSRLIKG
ncbi:MAG: hypothetical protein KAU99_06195 [Thermoplasmata archaeon]|nr:hypothetical protein [Thermoplasmata archaeon]